MLDGHHVEVYNRTCSVTTEQDYCESFLFWSLPLKPPTVDRRTGLQSTTVGFSKSVGSHLKEQPERLSQQLTGFRRPPLQIKSILFLKDVRPLHGM